MNKEKAGDRLISGFFVFRISLLRYDGSEAQVIQRKFVLACGQSDVLS